MDSFSQKLRFLISPGFSSMVFDFGHGSHEFLGAKVVWRSLDVFRLPCKNWLSSPSPSGNQWRKRENPRWTPWFADDLACPVRNPLEIPWVQGTALNSGWERVVIFFLIPGMIWQVTNGVSSFRPSYCQLLCQELFSAHMWRMSERAVPLFARRPSLGSSSSGEKQRNPLGPLGFDRTFKGEEQRLLRWLSAFEWQVWVIPVFRVFTQRSIEERKSYWEADFFWWTWLTAAFTSPTVTMDGHESFPGCLIV